MSKASGWHWPLLTHDMFCTNWSISRNWKIFT